jgi:hypothetical protein
MTEMGIFPSGYSGWTDTHNRAYQTAASQAARAAELNRQIREWPDLTNLERQLLIGLAQDLIKGDLRGIEHRLTGQAHNPDQLAKMLNILAGMVRCPGMTISDAVTARLVSADDHYTDVVFWSLTLLNAHRRLSLSSDSQQSGRVYGPSGEGTPGLNKELPEDPAVLFRQIAHLLSMPPYSTPPPMSGR